MAASRAPCGQATPEMAVRLFQGPQGIAGSGMASSGETLGSPWISLAMWAGQELGTFLVPKSTSICSRPAGGHSLLG
jgi:hypothetical protein